MNDDAHRLNRRSVLTLGAALGAALTTNALAGCATSSGGGTGTNAAGKQAAVTAENPLGVPADKPVETVIFKGGYGDQYVLDAHAIYKQRFPKAEIKHTGGQDLGKQLQPRFVSGDVPDLIDNSGSGSLAFTPLVDNGQLMDLTALLDAPAIDGGGKTVRDTLLPGLIEQGSFKGKPHVLYYTYTVHGLYYSKSLFAAKGWTYPTTWAEMLDLCAEIKATGMSPWTYQGKTPSYILTPLIMMAIKAGGSAVRKSLDSLAPDSWKQPAVLAAANAMYQLAEKGYVMPGTSGLTHVQAQTYWAKGRAAFIPCGSWLESELGTVTPKGFDMVIASPPSLDKSDAMPQAAIRGMGSEGYIVPSAAKNPYGGLELLRILLSPTASKSFTKQTQTLTSLAGYTPEQAGSGLQSIRDALAASGTNTFYWRYGTWYSKLQQEASAATSALMTKEINPDQWAQRCQKMADTLRNDPSVPKYEDA
ncbi:N-acetylglucosamine transport system substrate-binding protein [Hamadaea flava]|uniref:N-acetylglucosamine/diacetylchitobiose ABC transporter substrate-binding protein n=1 Tax=Hamadaea flava TaxID=1742688 RepID=A0ABV8LLM4_9ACTN|nr:N-acetylglucosamine/diacetylchitobiose ABC transporter substrate-binding protein [Hamadaea flava]MCP2329638.1 N-acetylglucosamine transport system substrate-binding protein [Hamadaea flava]